MHHGRPGLILAAALLLALVIGWNLSAEPFPNHTPHIPPHSVTQGGIAQGLVTQLLPSGSGHDRVLIVDPTTRVMSVYRIGRENGAITLESVRNVNWDLQLLHYNSEQPTPQEVRAGLERG